MTRFAVLLIAILSVAGLPTAQNTLPETSAAEMSKVDMIQGVIMNAGNSRIMITPDSGDMAEFTVSPNARITRDGETTQLEALQARDKVILMCSGEGQDRVAVDVVARSPL